MSGFEGMSDILVRYPSYLPSLPSMPLRPKDIGAPERIGHTVLEEVSEVVAGSPVADRPHCRAARLPSTAGN
jgi:hypothetical protein